MNEKINEVSRKFGNKIIGNNKVRRVVCEVVSLLSSEQIEFITKNVWFVNSFPDAWGFVFRGAELKGKYLVFLSDEAFRQPKADQYYEVAHELGHVLLKHRNSIGRPQTKSQITKQEGEADRFARQILQNE
jgi:hypothetical protein